MRTKIILYSFFSLVITTILLFFVVDWFPKHTQCSYSIFTISLFFITYKISNNSSYFWNMDNYKSPKSTKFLVYVAYSILILLGYLFANFKSSMSFLENTISVVFVILGLVIFVPIYFLIGLILDSNLLTWCFDWFAKKTEKIYINRHKEEFEKNKRLYEEENLAIEKENNSKAERVLNKCGFSITKEPFVSQINNAIKEVDAKLLVAQQKERELREESDKLSEKSAPIISKIKSLKTQIHDCTNDIFNKKEDVNIYKSRLNKCLDDIEIGGVLYSLVHTSVEPSIMEKLATQYSWTYDKDSKTLVGKFKSYTIRLKEGYYKTDAKDGTQTPYQVDEGKRDGRYKEGWKYHNYVTHYRDNYFKFYVGEKGIHKIKGTELFDNESLPEFSLGFNKSDAEKYKLYIKNHEREIEELESKLSSDKDQLSRLQESSANLIKQNEDANSIYSVACQKTSSIQSNKNELLEIKSLYEVPKKEFANNGIKDSWNHIYEIFKKIFLLFLIVDAILFFLYTLIHPEVSVIPKM